MKHLIAMHRTPDNKTASALVRVSEEYYRDPLVRSIALKEVKLELRDFLLTVYPPNGPVDRVDSLEWRTVEE